MHVRTAACVVGQNGSWSRDCIKRKKTLRQCVHLVYIRTHAAYNGVAVKGHAQAMRGRSDLRASHVVVIFVKLKSN